MAECQLAVGEELRSAKDPGSSLLRLKEEAMSRITIYTTRYCPFCIRAKMLLEHKGQPFDEIPVDADPVRRAEMQTRSGRHTVPQIWISGHHVGGCDELFALEMSGRLDALLKGDNHE